MKEATGEMTTTIIVIIGLVAVLTLATTFVWPTIRDYVHDKTEEISTEETGAGSEYDYGLH